MFMKHLASDIGDLKSFFNCIWFYNIIIVVYIRKYCDRNKNWSRDFDGFTRPQLPPEHQKWIPMWYLCTGFQYTLPLQPRKQFNIVLAFDLDIRAFLRPGEPGYFHCMPWCFELWSYWRPWFHPQWWLCSDIIFPQFVAKRRLKFSS
jgi:hypothetical protein